jgi:hypothetical protein
VGIAEIWNQPENVKFKSWDEFKVIIVTTDTANGSREFSGDVALSYFQNKRVAENLAQWVRKGGILLAEVQSIGGRPEQASYDAIFGSKGLRVLTSTNRHELNQGRAYENVLRHERGRSSRGNVALVSRAHHWHPVCFGIHPFLANGYSYSGEEIVAGHYREDGRSEFSLYYRCPELLYSGWFIDWERDWIPTLVESETAAWPVLLAKRDGQGLWLASTLRLNSAQALPLIRNIVFYPVFRELWTTYHDVAIRTRKRNDIVLVLGISVVGLFLIGVVVQQVGLRHLVEAFDWLHLGLGLSIAAVIALYPRTLRLIWRRPMSYPYVLGWFFRHLMDFLSSLFRRHP